MFQLGRKVFIDREGKVLESVIRGWNPSRHNLLFLELTTDNLVDRNFASGVGVLLRYQEKGVMYSLKGVFVTFLKNTGIWVFAFHEDIFQNSLRQNQRILCMLPGIISEGHMGRVKVKGVISDLSSGGVRILTKEQLATKEGEMVEVNFELDNETTVKDQLVEIKYHEHKDGHYIHAGPFHNLKPEYSDKIEKFIDVFNDWAVAKKVG